MLLSLIATGSAFLPGMGQPALGVILNDYVLYLRTQSSLGDRLNLRKLYCGKTGIIGTEGTVPIISKKVNVPIMAVDLNQVFG